MASSATAKFTIDEPSTSLPSTARGAPIKIDTTAVVTTASPEPSQNSCYLCDEQNPGDFSPTTKYLSNCALCSRYFCPVHQAVQREGICNTNHSQYYHECLARVRDELAQRSPDGTARRDEAEEVLIKRGIYPSVGEREIAIYRTSPVSEGRSPK